MNNYNFFFTTVSPLIMSAPQKCVIPKEKAMLCLFSFGADIIRGDTLFVRRKKFQNLSKKFRFNDWNKVQTLALASKRFWAES